MRFHLALGVHDIAESVAEYSAKLGCKPQQLVEGEYALWRTDMLNVSIRQTAETGIRHVGFEDPEAVSFSSSVDCNGIEWECFTQAQQQAEIRALWPNA